MGYVPYIADEGEEYGSSFEESVGLLRERLYKSDMTACRMFTHLMGQLYHRLSEEINNHKYDVTDLTSKLEKALNPKGAVLNNGTSIYWYEGDIYYNRKKLV